MDYCSVIQRVFVASLYLLHVILEVKEQRGSVFMLFWLFFSFFCFLMYIQLDFS